MAVEAKPDHDGRQPLISANPFTQGEVEAIYDKLMELMIALKR